ncbi:MAG TPA: response regulator [Candidatus Omnitrophota bacterium]|nr:response regulator [Candidatus Omnitrophota bacterium]HQJ15977.1 response regulator [Candidatus Omnitrophota bacterium]
MAQKSILIVDDDPEFLQEMQETLRLSGYKVDSLDRANSVVDHAAKNPPDLILLDLKMSGMTGFEVIKGLRGSPRTAQIPIIAMSGYFSEQKDCTLFDFFQIKQCLQKPFHPLDVISHIESTLKDADISI